MANMGSLTMSAFRPNFVGPTAEVKKFRRGGVPGHGLDVSEAAGIDQVVETDFITNDAGAIAHLAAAEAMVGGVFSCTDSEGQTFANTSILRLVGWQFITMGGLGAGNTKTVRIRWFVCPEN